MSSPHEVATLLFGRDKGLELLHAFVRQSSSDGGALMLSGAPGVGKTVLPGSRGALFGDAGLRVLRAAGAEFEPDAVASLISAAAGAATSS
jgi:hypothetical protein